MNDLQLYFEQNKGRLINKWHHYFEVYDTYLSKYRNKEIVILEIGVFQGGSLQMWKHYFGEKAKIYGVDINPDCKQFEEDNIEIFIGSQSDEKFLRELKSKIPPIDILIDDGGHEMKQQIVTFQELFSHIKKDGVYINEDLHTSYWFDYGGGYLRQGTFIEYSKKLIDQLNAYHSEQEKFQVNDFTKSAYSIHYYDSMIVIEKREISTPLHSTTGQPTIDFTNTKKTKAEKITYKLLHSLNKIRKSLNLSSVATEKMINKRP
jgi:hypothetical protein